VSAPTRVRRRFTPRTRSWLNSHPVRRCEAPTNGVFEAIGLIAMYAILIVVLATLCLRAITLIPELAFHWIDVAVSDFAGSARDVQGVADPRDADIRADPGAYRKLDGVWQCRFLKMRNALEKGYYSNWTFDAAEKKVVAFWSPVHKGDWFRYAWDGIKLVLDYPWGPPNPRFGAFDARGDGAELTIEMPAMCWKGWICNRAATEQWPADGLQYLNYARYPWLSGLAEDGPSIMKYRDPEQYRE